MREQQEPNLNMMLKSAITGLQTAYTNYKNAIIKDLQYSFYGDDGEFIVLAGSEERKQKIKDLEKEVVRLRFKVDEIKQEISGKENSNETDN